MCCSLLSRSDGVTGLVEGSAGEEIWDSLVVLRCPVTTTVLSRKFILDGRHCRSSSMLLFCGRGLIGLYVLADELTSGLTIPQGDPYWSINGNTILIKLLDLNHYPSFVPLRWVWSNLVLYANTVSNGEWR